MQPDLLSQLQDIQPPQDIGYWPLAWGWWLLILCTIALIVLLTIASYRLIQQRKAKKQALKLLKNIEATTSPIETVQHINSVLKRVMLAYCPREEVATLTGEKWAVYLNRLGHKSVPISAELTQLAYQANCSKEQAEQYLQQAKNWITKSLPLKQQVNRSPVFTGGENV